MINNICSAESPSKGSSLVIYDIMNELMGKKFSPQDPEDGMYGELAFLTVSHQRPCYGGRVYFSLVIFWLIILRKPKCL